MYMWVALNENATSKRMLWLIPKIKDFCWGNGKGPEAKDPGQPDAETISSWSYDMEGHAKKCVERYCELAKNN